MATQSVDESALMRKFRKIMKLTSAIEASIGSGVSKSAIDSWKYDGRIPSLDNADKVLRQVGYELKIVRIEEC